MLRLDRIFDQDKLVCFPKFLGDRSGAVVASFDSAVPPRDARIAVQSERLLDLR